MGRVVSDGTAGRPKGALFIEHSIGVSGSTISLCTLLRHLDRDLYAPAVVLGRASQQEFLRAAAGPDIDATVIVWRNGLKATRAGRALYEWAKRQAWPIKRFVTGLLALLDIGLVIAPYTFRLYRVARRHRTALVHHNNGLEPRTVLLAMLLRVPLVVYQRGEEWHSRAVRLLSRFVTAYVANSEATRQDLVELGVPAERIRVIYPPVDLDRFDPALDASRQRTELRLGPGAPVFGILGTLLEWKGHRVFLQAARAVMDALPNARALVIGEAPGRSQHYHEELCRLADTLGIADRVVFTGFRKDIPELVQVLDVVVHASITPEPFGRVIVEAMAMRKPVVATRAGGPLEIIENGVSGYLVPPDDAEALADRILQLLKDPAHRREIGERARREVEARFSARVHARLVEEVYAEALSVRGGGRAVANGVKPCHTSDPV